MGLGYIETSSIRRYFRWDGIVMVFATFDAELGFHFGLI